MSYDILCEISTNGDYSIHCLTTFDSLDEAAKFAFEFVKPIVEDTDSLMRDTFARCYESIYVVDHCIPGERYPLTPYYMAFRFNLK